MIKDIWTKIKKIASKLIIYVREAFASDREDEDEDEDAAEIEYAREVIKNFESNVGSSFSAVVFDEQKVAQFEAKRRAQQKPASSLLKKGEDKRDSILSLFVSSARDSAVAIMDGIWDIACNLPAEVYSILKENLYQSMLDAGELNIIKPTIDPTKFYGKYSGEETDYLPLFSEKEKNFMSLSMREGAVNIKERAKALLWYYEKENDLEWGNIYLSRLYCCDPPRTRDLRVSYLNVFTEVWDDEETKLTEECILDLALNSDEFFNESLYRMKLEKEEGPEWFKDAYGREFIDN